MRFSNISLALVFCTLGFIMFDSSLAQNSPQDFLDPQNAARAEVGVGPLQWDKTLADYAQNYANQRSQDCVLQHSGGPYGENIYGSPGPGLSGFNAKDAVASWVEEKQNYDHDTNSCAQGKVCGHYTQVVWRNSVRLGCARVVCPNDGGLFITCNYDPRGNFNNESPY